MVQRFSKTGVQVQIAAGQTRAETASMQPVLVAARQDLESVSRGVLMLAER